MRRSLGASPRGRGGSVTIGPCAASNRARLRSACSPRPFVYESSPGRRRTAMWQPFTEEHAQFRKTVRQFAEKELAPHAEEWEADEMLPNWVFKRAGELGILGAHFPEEHGGAGLDYWFSVAKAEELVHSRLAGVNMGLLVQSDMATPVISDIGTKE